MNNQVSTNFPSFAHWGIKDAPLCMSCLSEQLLLLSLREALLRAAGGPEAFLSIRAAYTASLAVVSMAGYIAGVGDRHTDNFLVDLSSGTLVPIDFG